MRKENGTAGINCEKYFWHVSSRFAVNPCNSSCVLAERPHTWLVDDPKLDF